LADFGAASQLRDAAGPGPGHPLGDCCQESRGTGCRSIAVFDDWTYNGRTCRGGWL